MSGFKSSNISYDRRGELILTIRSTKEDLLRKLKALKKQMEDLHIRIKEAKLSIKNKSLLGILNNYIDTLNERGRGIENKENEIDNFVVRTGASIGKLEDDRKTLVKEYDYINKIANEINTINQKMSTSVEIDNMIPKLETDFNEVEHLLSNNRKLLQEWAPEEYGKLINQNASSKDKFNKYRIHMDSGKPEDLNVSSLREIYKDVSSNINKIENMITDSTVKDGEVKSLKKRIEKLRQDINEQTIYTKNSDIKNLLSEYLNKLKTSETGINKKKYEGIEQRLNGISHSLSILKKADEINSNIEAEMHNIESVFKENDAILRKWVKNDHEINLKEKESLCAELDKYKKNLQSREVADITNVSNISEKVKNLSDKIASSLSIATEKDKLHQKRLYVIKSLREVCASLGFQEIDEPHYSEKDNPYSPAVQSFDTLIYGTITFNVSLEGKLESSSCISVDNCDEEFSRFSELLKEQFGIETSLKRIEEGEPIKKYKTAKDFPTSAGKLSQGK
jgi:hypothetical protein